MPNDKAKPENAAQQETGGDCVSRIVRRCPVCGKAPTLKRYSLSYWYAKCEESHFGDSSASPMKTQKAAWEAWDFKFPPNRTP